jgi:hypothetical protein
MDTDTAEANAGTPDVRAGGVFAAHSQASLQMALQKLRSIRCANYQHWPRTDGLSADGGREFLK